MIIGVTLGTIFIRRFPNSHTIIGIIGFIPSSIACFLLLFLPWSAKPGLLVGIYLLSTNGVGFIMILSLCAVSFAGHTKKMAVNAIFLVGTPWVKCSARNSGRRNIVQGTLFRGSFNSCHTSATSS